MRRPKLQGTSCYNDIFLARAKGPRSAYEMEKNHCFKDFEGIKEQLQSAKR